MRRPNAEKIGKKYGRWLVLEYAGDGLWLCRCDCGNTGKIMANSLTSGNSRSCGCYHRDVHTTHGLSYTAEHNVHVMMLQRCYNPKHTSYKDYGGRGIKVCERWKGPDGLANFVADLGMKPTPKHKLDRIDNDGDYEPGNCRWATEAVQQRNTSRNVNLTWGGRTMCLKDWAKELGIGYQTLRYRVSEWGVERAMTERVRRKQPVGFVERQTKRE
jgi:hypothetical protein